MVVIRYLREEKKSGAVGNKGAQKERGEREIEKERDRGLVEERVLGGAKHREGRRKKDERQRQELKNQRKEK